MSEAAAIGDAALALTLFIRNPQGFGGMVLRGSGPLRDDMVEAVREHTGRRGAFVKIPSTVDQERLLGGLDLTATLASGHSVMRPGLLESAAGGAVLLPMAERLSSATAAHIAQAMDNGSLSAILLDDGEGPDEAPPAVLCERMAFHCELSALRTFQLESWPDEIALADVEMLSDDQLRAIAATSVALGIASARALHFAQLAVRAHAALHGRTRSLEEDVAAAIRLVFSPRATQLPQNEPAPPRQDQPEDGQADGPDEERQIDDIDMEDIMLEAAAAAIPRHILDRIDGATRRTAKGQGGKAGQKQKSALRGRPMGSRRGVPGHGKRLALIDSLRAAAPWQAIRRERARAEDRRTVHIRKSDLRIRHYRQRAESLTIFAVDASGSSALARLAEAKGAVEQMLAAAYVKRSQVALIAFRQAGSELLLPPTRSLTRARRALAELPGGGGTPLAAGLMASRQLAEMAQRAGQTPTIAILTDGKGNVAIDGSADRTTAMDESLAAARTLAAASINSIVIDISPRPRDEAASLAAALGGRYLPLPHANSAKMVAAIEGL